MLAKLGAALTRAHALRCALELFVHKKTRSPFYSSEPGLTGTL
jgi:hypothetical protein